MSRTCCLAWAPFALAAAAVTTAAAVVGNSIEDSISLLQSAHGLELAVNRQQPAAVGSAKPSEYYWPSGTGRIQNYTSSPFAGARNLKESLSWTWHNPTLRYATVPGGANIDDEKNIYLEALDGIRKFSPDGKMLWAYLPPREFSEEMPDMSSLYKGALYVSTTKGRIIAISMETGEEIWKTKLPSCDGNNGWVSVEEGVVITSSDARAMKRGRQEDGRVADQFVTALNATDGRVLWNIQPDAPLWNFMGSFAGDGTFVFQDYEARAYRCRLLDGKILWKAGGIVDSWTDGSALLGPNRVVYTVGNQNMQGGRDAPGYVSAFRLEDGKMLWRATVPRPPNNMPAIGRLAGRKGLSLVQPIGQQCQQGNPTDVYALDAETGELQWIFNGPSQKLDLQAGDANNIAKFHRVLGKVRPITLPNPWSAPTIDGNGIVYIGSEEGLFYSLADTNQDGKVLGEDEVSSMDVGACFSGSAAAAIAPGMMVATSIDAMYVFKA